jgi:hypothetical protein
MVLLFRSWMPKEKSESGVHATDQDAGGWLHAEGASRCS